jgi:ribosome biogenesis GTPase
VVQVVAANIDTVFVVTAFGFDLNPRRLERYLTSAWDSGSAPVVVVNKIDTADDPMAELLEIEPVTMGVSVHAVSAVTADGLDALDQYLQTGKTIALLGSSGVGKSTLVNRFAGREVLATADISAGGRGRHTTSHRELVPLPSGAVLLDTPGMRELQLWAGEEVLDTTFSEISELAAQCKFSDCAHKTEPGCAIRRALNDGTLSRERWASYQKLQREARALAIRKDARLRSEARKQRAKFARSRRKTAY